MENSYVFVTEQEARDCAEGLSETFKTNETKLMFLNTQRLIEFMELFSPVEDDVREAIAEKFGNGGEPITIVSFRMAVKKIVLVHPTPNFNPSLAAVFFPAVHPEMALRGDNVIMFNRDFSVPLASVDIQESSSDNILQ